MFRRYISFAIPVMCSAVAALVYLHFRSAPAVQAAPPVERLAQADPDDPFKPPVKKPPVVKPVDPAQPVDPADPAKPKTQAKRMPRREIPKNDDEVQTPFLKNLLVQLDGFDDASDDDKGSVRKMIYDADVELSDSMGDNMRRRIVAANRKHSGFVVSPGPRKANGPTIKRKDVLPGAKADPVPVPDPAPLPEKLQPE